ncbi:uncharacterized protein BT62DRAFT_331522 [Guyanagaster necrorhizus]|uniref:Uncharacterized protein n=1 Tax=Guyanagaster necrorhizus TaxID=856835 RepID=A0A9P8APK3_9AGAR|nr:uncharacterized protein BT62DRAFT_331522 [Guyanagaster necrorhizus MCA 3950]KAG7443433.1 hypothetical protein BT62DRAFT_331522 [Guyanagaster necrorhizus MCA 3950]
MVYVSLKIFNLLLDTIRLSNTPLFSALRFLSHFIGLHVMLYTLMSSIYRFIVLFPC